MVDPLDIFDFHNAYLSSKVTVCHAATCLISHVTYHSSNAFVDPLGLLNIVCFRVYVPKSRRDGKSYQRCWCKELPTGVKILVESVIKGGVKN